MIYESMLFLATLLLPIALVVAAFLLSFAFH